MENGQECGGAYIKLLDQNVDQSKFSLDTPYLLMFGPDVCGGLAEVVIAIRIQDAMYADWKKMIPAPIDHSPHLYRLTWKKNGKYEVQIDGIVVAQGSIEDDFDLGNPRLIPDPNDKKPLHLNEKIYNDVARIADKLKTIPKMLTDPTDTKPTNWNSRLDGEWTQRQVINADYISALEHYETAYKSSNY